MYSSTFRPDGFSLSWAQGLAVAMRKSKLRAFKLKPDREQQSNLGFHGERRCQPLDEAESLVWAKGAPETPKPLPRCV